MEKKFRHEVMMMAYEIFSSTGDSWSVCLAKAWQLYRLKGMFRTGAVKFAYAKTDGTLRRATGTLKDVPAGLVKGTGKKNFKTVCYFDADAGAFRSFRVESLVTIY
ncbi:SH3 beta-barrel fold-containing protein [Bacteroides sp. K03]|uniref:SH3 beta-barrel fold-containing protein n=1 Tax=Bacteroides sp. K03 TaxID=2718928 RepID=UPI002101F6B6|nr:SH3 beta-barrel fold-containing protein [Bacteroides sp. K03]